MVPLILGNPHLGFRVPALGLNSGFGAGGSKGLVKKKKKASLRSSPGEIPKTSETCLGNRLYALRYTPDS